MKLKINFFRKHFFEIYRFLAPVFYCLFGAIIALISCQPEWEKVNYSSGVRLFFSNDTVNFDTLFSGMPSPTLRLKAYNPLPQSLIISEISLAEKSPFRIVVNGVSSSKFINQRLLGKDSLLILISLVPPEGKGIYRISEKLLFVLNGQEQYVFLEAYGREGIFLRDSILCNQTWTPDLPFVITEDVLVDSLCTLTILEGCEIYLAPKSDFFVKGSLRVLGSAEHPVFFRQIRKDLPYQTLPGQWNGITFLPGSNNNLIRWAHIQNAVNGFYLGTPDNDTITDLLVSHTIIQNMSRNGFQAYNSDLRLENCLVNNCIEGNALVLIGGNYYFIHCTFANYGFNFSRDLPGFIVSNYLPGQSLDAPLFMELTNTIIWGSLSEELLFLPKTGIPFLLKTQNNLLKTQIKDLNTNQNILNKNPRFKNAKEQDFSLDTLSPAKDKGLPVGIEIDLKGKKRDSKPDIGAYERLE